MSEIVFKDKAGEKLDPGDFIVYAATDGRSAALRYGRVLPQNESKKSCLQVRAYRDGWNGGEVFKNPVYLGYQDRVHRIPAMFVPENIRTLLLKADP